MRCFDCFAEITVAYAMVLKKLREVPADADPVEAAAFLNSLCHDPAPVCVDCAGWYGEHAWYLPAEESAS